MEPGPELGGENIRKISGGLIMGRLQSIPFHMIAPIHHKVLKFVRPCSGMDAGQRQVNT